MPALAICTGSLAETLFDNVQHPHKFAPAWRLAILQFQFNAHKRTVLQFQQHNLGIGQLKAGGKCSIPELRLIKLKIASASITDALCNVDTRDIADSQRLNSPACEALSRSAQRPNEARLSVMLEIVVDIGVSGFHEIFDEANYFFQFVSLD
jgi:hypothetical protein